MEGMVQFVFQDTINFIFAYKEELTQLHHTKVQTVFNVLTNWKSEITI